jgi:hypothetical protein
MDDKIAAAEIELLGELLECLKGKGFEFVRFITIVPGESPQPVIWTLSRRYPIAAADTRFLVLHNPVSSAPLPFVFQDPQKLPSVLKSAFCRLFNATTSTYPSDVFSGYNRDVF